MNGEDVLEVLKEIRDEMKQTNARLDQTNNKPKSRCVATEIVTLAEVTREVRNLLERIDGSKWRVLQGAD